MSDSLYDPPFPQSPIAVRRVPDDLEAIFLARLGTQQRAVLDATIVAAASHGYRLYVVGGGVRDLLLASELPPVFDLDFVVEGDAIAIAQQVFMRLGGDKAGHRLTTHAVFGTATIGLADTILHIDFASARNETYAHPAALPTVRYPTTLSDDLRRRDFTINTLAFALYTPDNDPPPYTLIDRFGGLVDLRRGLIRVLHDQSFEDDPTRLYRAVRFAGRLGYRLDPHTLELMRAEIAAGGVTRLTAERLQHELKAILHESLPHPAAALALAGRVGLLVAIDPRLLTTSQLLEDVTNVYRVSKLSNAGRPSWIAYLTALFWRLGERAAREIAETRLRFAQTDAQIPIEVAHLYDVVLPALQQAKKMANSEVATIFEGVTIDSVKLFTYFIARDNPDAYEVAMRFANLLNNIKTSLNGNDIIRLGVPRGPAVGQVLKRLRNAKLDNLSATHTDEEAWVQQWLQDGDL